MTAELTSLLQEVRLLLDALVAARNRRDEWRAVEQASRACEAELAEQTDTLARLRQQQAALTMRLAYRNRPAMDRPPAARPTAPALPAQRAKPRAPEAAPATIPASQARRSFSALVNRFGVLWRVEESALGQINGILDAGRPLGEGIALLPWAAFETPLGPTETSDRHLRRLGEWKAALEEHQQLLTSEVELLEMRLAGWSGVHELWRQRADGAGGQAAWEEYLAGRRRDLAAATAAVQTEIDGLRGELKEEGAPE
jgi:hypothetical protein